MEQHSLVGKVEEKNEGSKNNVVDIPQEGSILPQARSTHPETQTSSNEPQQEEETLEKNPNNIREEVRRGEVGKNQKGEAEEEGIPVRRSQRVQNLSKPSVQ